MLPTSTQEQSLKATTSEYIAAVNTCADWMYTFESVGRMSSKHVPGQLPSALKNQALRDAKSIWAKYRKGACASFPVLRKPVAYWNNQNYRIKENSISLPLWCNGKSCINVIKAIIPQYALDAANSSKLGTLRIVNKSGKWVAQFAVDSVEPIMAGTGSMGVDLGIKCPAVCYTDTGKVRFFGNGRSNKAMRRRFYAKRKKLGKAKKLNAIRKIEDKEQRIMRDIDHKISRQIINFAVANHIGVIKLETLQNIRKHCTTRTRRKNNRSINSWSFYRLASFIEYKAALAGIDVVYVNPAYTSQTCPVCGCLNHADDRKYKCSCGYEGHRDIVGAVNILAA